MGEFGSATVIGKDTRLVLFDCFETLVEIADAAYRPRRGIEALLDHLRRRGVGTAVISDAPEANVSTALAQAGLWSRFGRLYHAGNAQERLPEGRMRKRLDVPLADHGIAPGLAVFVGDSPFDALDARHYGVPFIRVPRSEDRSFSFSRLIAGPSRYSSGDFTRRFLRHYRPAEDRS